MRMRNGLLAGALVGAAVAGALVAVWFLAGWWILLWAPLLILLVLLGGVTVAAEKSRPAPRGGVSSAEPGGTAGFAPEPRWELDPVVRREVASVELPSAERDYTFLFSATVCRTGAKARRSTGTRTRWRRTMWCGEPVSTPRTVTPQSTLSSALGSPRFSESRSAITAPG